MKLRYPLAAILVLLGIGSLYSHKQHQADTTPKQQLASITDTMQVQAVSNPIAIQTAKPNSPPLVAAARSQIGQTLYYDAAYTVLSYPMGDVAMIKGVCTDVIIRALRSQGVDLQQLIHEDMRANFAAYPKKWGLKRADSNIDHRRVPNIQTYFQRQHYHVAPNSHVQAGDIITWDLGSGLVHIGIASDRVNAQGKALIIHNIGRGTQEEDILYRYPITGHFRLPAS